MASDRGNRRTFLRTAGAVGGGLVLAGLTRFAHAQETRPSEKEEDISANEDLMREHGVLRRALLVYDAALHQGLKPAMDPAVIHQAAIIIRDFIENYHEKNEEEVVFPRFRQAKELTDLVPILLRQHQAGRKVTARILALTSGASVVPAADPQQELRERLGQFIRMYRPHAAREDTVLFPAVHRVFGPDQYDKLGDQLEDRERAQFGHDGFEQYVDKVAELEKQVGIYDLAEFTPAV